MATLIIDKVEQRVPTTITCTSGYNEIVITMISVKPKIFNASGYSLTLTEVVHDLKNSPSSLFPNFRLKS